MQSIWSSLLLQVDIPIFTEDHKVHRTAEHLFFVIFQNFTLFFMIQILFVDVSECGSNRELFRGRDDTSHFFDSNPYFDLPAHNTRNVSGDEDSLESCFRSLSTLNIRCFIHLTYSTDSWNVILSAESNDRMNKINKFNVNFRWCLAKASHIFILFSNHPSLQVLKARQPSWPAQWRAELTEWSPGSGETCTLSSSAAETSSSHQTPGSVSPTPQALRTGCWALPRPGWLTVVTTSARSTLSPRSTWASDSMFYVSHLLSRRL